MANLKSSKKDILRTKRNYDRNQHWRTKLKNAQKKALLAIDENIEQVQSVVFSTCRLVDKCSSKGILKKNTAARKKSRLMRKLHAVSSAK